MKMIELEDMPQSHYPVGENIVTNIPIFQRLAIEFSRISEYKDEVLNVFVTGSSGNIAATIFAMTVRNRVVIYSVKKDEEYSHNKGDEARIKTKGINIIIDDEVSTGHTIRDLYNKILYQNNRNFQLHVLLLKGMVIDIGVFPTDYAIASHFSSNFKYSYEKSLTTKRIEIERKDIVNTSIIMDSISDPLRDISRAWGLKDNVPKIKKISKPLGSIAQERADKLSDILMTKPVKETDFNKDDELPW